MIGAGGFPPAPEYFRASRRVATREDQGGNRGSFVRRPPRGSASSISRTCEEFMGPRRAERPPGSPTGSPERAPSSPVLLQFRIPVLTDPRIAMAVPQAIRGHTQLIQYQ